MADLIPDVPDSPFLIDQKTGKARSEASPSQTKLAQRVTLTTSACFATTPSTLLWVAANIEVAVYGMPVRPVKAN